MTKTDRMAGIPEDLKVYGVTESGKVYWAKRNARGQFVTAYGRNRADGLSTDYAAYVEAQVSQAEQETRGKMLTGPALRRGIAVEDVMAGRRSIRWATEELRGWMAVHGRTLRFLEYRAQVVESEAA